MKTRRIAYQRIRGLLKFSVPDFAISFVQLRRLFRLALTAVVVSACVAAGVHRLGLRAIARRTHTALGVTAGPKAVSKAIASSAGTFKAFEVPGAGTDTLEGTVVFGINASGDVTGPYFDANQVAHGYIRSSGGSIERFDAPGAGSNGPPSVKTSRRNQGTIPIAMNAAGVVTGFYVDANYAYHGFVRGVSGEITEFDVPGAISASGSQTFDEGTRPIGINSAGVVVGTYNACLYDGFCYSAFVRVPNGTITSFSVPGAGQGGITVATGINDSGEIVGSYADETGTYHGFIRSTTGVITEFDAPGSGVTSGNQWTYYQGTVPIAINSSGETVGTYTDSSGVRHGFVRTASGTFEEFSVPGAGTGVNSNGQFSWAGWEGTGGVGLDADGNIAGFYLDSNLSYHGFLRTSGGALSALNEPGAGKGALEGTGAFGLSGSGEIAGTYVDDNLTAHGFIFIPQRTPTTTSLTSSPNPSFYGENVTLRATVSSDDGDPPNGETVSFLQVATVLGDGTLSGGTATFKTSKLPVGQDPISAAYPGGANFTASTSIVVKQEVGKANTSAVLTSSVDPSSFNQSVTFTASVKPQFSGTPTGTVTFHHGATKIGMATLGRGVAHFSIATLPVGADAITAAYSGDQNFAASTSKALNQVVSRAASTTVLSSSANPSNVGKSVTFTVTVTGKYGGVPTGMVTYTDGKAALKIVPLSGGTARLTTSTLSGGKHTIGAAYAGSAEFGTSSASLAQTVK